MVEEITDSIKICSYTNSMELGRLLGLNETINMLNMIRESPKQYKDIISNVTISDPSLSRRLNMLQCLNIIKKERIRSNGRKTHSYNLTLQGEKVMKFICSLITVEDIKRSREFYEKLLKQKVKYDFGQNVTFHGDFAIHLQSHYQKLINIKK